MATWNNKLIKRQFRWTSKCYHKAVLEYYGDVLTDDEKKLPPDAWPSCVSYTLGNIDINTPELNNIYLKYVCELHSIKLSLILEAVAKGVQRRAQHTVDVISTELFERAANSETRRKHE